jgi:diaminohydroxyphosphoribosylaminopyrimidine deaminase/5-amino-6-(5-phosphoribosylamino)uracil reductase
MTQALMLAQRGKLTTSPNPIVGCVVVKNGKIVGEGFHHHKSGKHAEIKALSIASKHAKNSTVYVTLEPCCYTSSTKPCTDALVKAGVKKVVIATMDPNPKVCKKGIMFLENHGIDTIIGVLEQEAKNLNKIFFYYKIFFLPYLVAKWAMSLDGQVKTNASDDRKISSDKAQKLVHNLRNQYDAIMIGVNTITKDNSSLMVRNFLSLERKNPVRVVISKDALIGYKAKIVDTRKSTSILFTTKLAHKLRIKVLKNKGVECNVMPGIDTKYNISLLDVLKILAKKSITSILLEGRSNLHNAFFKLKLVNEIKSFISPSVIGNLNKKCSMKNFKCQMINSDVQFSAYTINFLN